jgi:hypothetical protein
VYQIINIRDKNISVQLEENMVDIISDEQLLELATKMPEAATDELVSTIKREYHTQFSKDFSVTDASMAVEIWGHIYAEEFAEAVETATSVKLVDELAEKIKAHCEVINIGTRGHDYNRIIWDTLSPFKQPIAALLLKPDHR